MNDNSSQLLNQQRIRSLDLIRGIAVLGILVMNIQSFSMPFVTYSNPLNYGDLSGANYWTWYLSHIFFDQKFMGIFSILFGVGVFIFAERVDAREGHSGKRHYIRMMWLLVFGMLHAYFIWYGDILVAYAISGCLVYLFRNAKLKTLWLSALGLIGFASLVFLLQGFMFPYMPAEVATKEIIPMWSPAQEVLQLEIDAYRGTWLNAFAQRIEQASLLQSYMAFYLPKILGLNLLGMALYKSGFFNRRWPSARYAAAGILLVGLGVTLSYLGAEKNLAVDFLWKYSIAFGIQYNYWGSLFSALGYCCILMLLANNIDGNVVKRAFARVGQMAFTNYILQSIICTTIFYGFGLGLFGEVERIEQVYITLGVWSLLIVFSYIWLEKFRMGPLEKLWRQLTYGKSLNTQKTQA